MRNKETQFLERQNDNNTKQKKGYSYYMIENVTVTSDASILNIEKLLLTLVGLIQQKSESKSSLEILTQKELLSQLNISPNTLKSWENLGLKRLEPPIEGTRCVYYEAKEVLRFLAD